MSEDSTFGRHVETYRCPVDGKEYGIYWHGISYNVPALRAQGACGFSTDLAARRFINKWARTVVKRVAKRGAKS